MPDAFIFDESDRRAIAERSIERPGWVWYLGDVAAKLGGREMYDRFRDLELSPPPEPPE